MQSYDRYDDSGACSVPISVAIVSSLLGSFISFFFWGGVLIIHLIFLYYINIQYNFCNFLYYRTPFCLSDLYDHLFYLRSFSKVHATGLEEI